jgi:hypothetical protein
MSFLKSKHSGWTHELKRTPFGGGGGSVIEDVGSFITDNLPTIALGAGALALGQPELLALDAGTVAAADGVAMSTYGMTASEALASGISAEALGLPAAATAADVGAIAGTASAEFAGTAAGSELIGATAPAVAPTTEQTAQKLATQLGYSDPIAAIAGGVNPADLGLVQSGTGGLSDILGYAKTGAQVIGGLGQLAGGVGQIMGGSSAMKAGKAVGELAKQADPYAAYRPQAAAQLQNLLSDPSTITKTPGYQFQLGQGLQALQAQQASQGRLVSGGALLQAQQFGQNYAQSNLQQQQQLLAQLSGATQSPASAATAQAGLIGGQLGGQLGGLQSIASGVGGVINPLQTLYAQYNTPSPSVT